MTRPPTALEEALTREHVAAHRAELRPAHEAVVRACRGLLVGPVGIGFDHTLEDPVHAWWARVRLSGGRAGTELLEEGHPSALAALEALGPRIVRTIRARRRR